jgi:hypothetical protein
VAIGRYDRSSSFRYGFGGQFGLGLAGSLAFLRFGRGRRFWAFEEDADTLRDIRRGEEEDVDWS